MVRDKVQYNDASSHRVPPQLAGATWQVRPTSASAACQSVPCSGVLLRSMRRLLLTATTWAATLSFSRRYVVCSHTGDQQGETVCAVAAAWLRAAHTWA
jgi:hypothetical protein